MTTDDYPADMSNHVRDPKIFKKNEKYYMVLGARDVEGVGMILYMNLQILRTGHTRIASQLHRSLVYVGMSGSV